MKLSILLIIFAFFLTPCVAQVNKITKFEAQIDNKKTVYKAIVPESLSKVFFDNRAAGYSTKPALSNEIFLNSILKKIRLVSISRDVVQPRKPRIIRKKNGIIKIIGTKVSHPSFYQSAVLGKRLYIFNRSNEIQSAEVFNQIVRDLKVSVTNADEAKQLVELFLLFYTINYKDPKQVIISKIEDIPEKDRGQKQEIVEQIKDSIQPPKVLDLGDSYKVEFLTWEEQFWSREVNKWQIEVSKNGEINLKQELLGTI